MYNYLDYKCFSIPHHRKPNRFKPSKQMMKLLEGYLQIPNWGHTENNMNRLYHKKILLLDIYLSCLCVYIVISSHVKTHMRKNNSFVCLFICVYMSAFNDFSRKSHHGEPTSSEFLQHTYSLLMSSMD